MSDIRIHRPHRLGLSKAREVACQWAEEVEQRFDMTCTVIEGDGGDTVEFRRTGVDGRLLVRADHFDLEARLGFLLGAFSNRIEAEIERNLDALLAEKAKRQGKAAHGHPIGEPSGDARSAASKKAKPQEKAQAPSRTAGTPASAKRNAATSKRMASK